VHACSLSVELVASQERTFVPAAPDGPQVAEQSAVVPGVHAAPLFCVDVHVAIAVVPVPVLEAPPLVEAPPLDDAPPVVVVPPALDVLVEDAPPLVEAPPVAVPPPVAVVVVVPEPPLDDAPPVAVVAVPVAPPVEEVPPLAEVVELVVPPDADVVAAEVPPDAVVATAVVPPVLVPPVAALVDVVVPPVATVVVDDLPPEADVFPPDAEVPPLLVVPPVSELLLESELQPMKGAVTATPTTKGQKALCIKDRCFIVWFLFEVALQRVSVQSSGPWRRGPGRSALTDGSDVWARPLGLTNRSVLATTTGGQQPH